ncbi:MAG: ABC transporter permease [Acidimicrobiia bacterium]
MFRLTVKTLWSHKRRLIGTFAAVAMGVAFLSGTLVLSDTLRASFDDLFSRATAGVDAVVRSSDSLNSEFGTQRPLLDDSLGDTLGGVDGVAEVAPNIEGYGAIIGEDGEPIGGQGPPQLAGNWIDDTELNPYQLVEGKAPRRFDEVVINRTAANDAGLEVGDEATIQTPDPVKVKVVGLASFGPEDSAGGVTFVAFTTDAAQRLVLKREGQVTSFLLRAEEGVSQDDLVAGVRAVLPDGVESITGAELTAESIDELGRDFLNFFSGFLTSFAVVALLVATFSIYNTFSILVAQRTRESALLRALGASRRQVLSSIVGEAAVVGVVSSVAGLIGGVIVALALKGLFDALGFGLPAGGLVFEPGAVVASLLVGLVVTLVAGVMPAVKASRVPPLAALRDVALERTRASVARAVAGLVLIAAGALIVLVSVLGGGEDVLARAGAGAAATIIGVVVFGPVIARPAAGAIGWPLPRLRGITGLLARENAMRNPRRTAGTASALMVGVGVVTLFTVVGASIKQSIDDSVARSFGGDLVITTGGFGPAAGFSPKMAGEVARLSEVEAATGFGGGVVRLDGATETVGVADPDSLTRVLDLDETEGRVADLAGNEIAISTDKAEDEGWEVGTEIPVAFVDGATQTVRVGAVYDSSDVAGPLIFTRAVFDPHAVQSLDQVVFVLLTDGVALEDGKAAVEEVTDGFGSPNVQDKQEFLDTVAGGVNQMLALVYVMLTLAIMIALMGIANTLSLSVHERTRELGLLRAVGETRGQLRSMVRWESVVIALFGTVGGVGLGIFLGWALVLAASSEGIASFSAPPGQMVTVLIAGAIVGVFAGLRPAARAAKLNVLAAIASE